MDYPTRFPEPTINGYGINVKMGVVRGNLSMGYAKQRRKYKTMPQRFSLSFAIPIELLNDWQTWVNDNAYVYFNINLTSYHTTTGKCSTHSVRFTSDLAITPLTPRVFTVSVTAEENHTVGITKPPLPVTCDWIIAKTASDPSSPDWYIANTPSTIPADVVIGGNPATVCRTL